MIKAVIELQKPPKKKSIEVTEQEIRPSVAASGGLSTVSNAAEKLNKKRQSVFAETSLDNSQKMEVLFNPSEIHISAGGKLSKEKTGVDKNKRNVDYGSNGTKIRVSIPLIFEEPEALKEPDENSAKGISLKNNMTNQINMLLAAVGIPYSRKIIFRWGSQIYSGNLQSVTAEYLMFNTQGIPIRAKVTIDISCTINQKQIKAGNIYE